MTCWLVLILSAVMKSSETDSDSGLRNSWISEPEKFPTLFYTMKLLKHITELHWPELCRLMLRRLGKRRGRMSLLSWMDARLLLAITRVSRLGNMEPNLRTSAQSLRLLSVMWSRRREGQATLEALTLLYSLRHRNNSSSLQVTTQR